MRERRARRAKSPTVSYRAEPTGTFAAGWAAADTEAERRAVLQDDLVRLVVRRGRAGRQTKAKALARLSFQWADTLHTDAEEYDENPADLSAPAERIPA